MIEMLEYVWYYYFKIKHQRDWSCKNRTIIYGKDFATYAKIYCFTVEAQW